ncbi:LTA synthase family protein [Fulvimonas sp. R45]|uniref:LTA synthase family protein n=1 Tax=Fulvimonas sp. R45 TaxID=3045937 RepID=UPI00265ED5C2|nr:LTA synthase family protein [Fulvimonas sp. R45]MDO1528787.1 LTA synthase family protein [Fulvimonas sp. R45]
MSLRPQSALRTRFQPLIWLGVCFVAVSFVTRLILLLMTGHGVPPNPLYWLYAFGVGLGYDLVAFVYFAWPMVLFLWLVPTRRGRLPGWKQWLWYALAVVALCAICLGLLRLSFDANWKTAWPAVLPFLFVLPLAAFTYTSRLGQWILYAFCLLLLFGLLFVGASELTFWNEFGTRFNFIAVDYLIYTREVVGNIEESYPIARWLTMLAVLAVVIVVLSRRTLRTQGDGSRFGTRSLVVLGWLVVTVVTVFAVNADMKNRLQNTYVNSLAGNGIYEFFSAFRNSKLNFHRFYRQLPDGQAYALLRDMLKTPDATFVGTDPHDLTREIRNPAPERHLNVVLISVESLSGSYLGTFGDTRGLTPNLDKLVDQSLFFDHLYANGTRTVRGLEALSLSVPPTPGDSLIKQKHNDGLFSLADIFNQRGYVSEFVYGGYGYFDNMNQFFGSNGYKDVDRRDIPAGTPIHSENVWGVADEDLYTLAMQQMDAIHATGKPFFLHIMTTSNHRPYTFPTGRVDMPEGQRDSAVKYTDWAIGDFLRRMREKPYFDDTVFVITADHCAASAGSTRIPLNRYHIPLLIYAPAQVKPRRVEKMMAQVDIPPTVLGLLHFSYRSRFFGRDIFQVPDGEERAFPSTYSNLGYLRGERLTILSPGRKVEQVKPDPATGAAVPYAQVDQAQVDQAIAAYQVAYDEFNSGRMRWRASDATPVAPAPEAVPTTQPATAASTAPAPASSTH